MSTVIVSNVPQSISNEKLHEFFSFCGKVKSINLIEKRKKLENMKFNSNWKRHCIPHYY